MNAQKEFIEDHTETARLYLGYWTDQSSRPEGLSEEEIAYEALLHTGMVHRYGGDEVWPEVKALPFEERQRLIVGASIYAAEVGFAKKAEAVAQAAMTDDSAIDEYEQFVYERDQLDAVIYAAQLIGGMDVVLGSPQGNTAFDTLLDAAIELEDVLAEHEYFTAECAGTVLFLMEQLDPERRKPSLWWASKLRAIQQEVYGPDPVIMALWRASQREQTEQG